MAAEASTSGQGPGEMNTGTTERRASGGSDAAKFNEQKFWLNAFTDRVANIYARSDCICLCDVFGDHDKRLVVVDASQKKLKLWKGTTLEAELKLVDNPVALCSVYGDNSKKRIPALCVAAGPHIYIYRNLRAYYKFTLPDLAFSDKEKQVWEGLAEAKLSIEQACDQLVVLREEDPQGGNLSQRSNQLIAMSLSAGRDDMQSFVAKAKGVGIHEQTAITCICSIPKSVEDEGSQESLLVGTENGKLHVIDPVKNFEIVHTIDLPSAPVQLAATGAINVEYKVVVLGRDAKVYNVVDGQLTSHVLDLHTSPIAIICSSKFMAVGCMNKTIYFYNLAGGLVHNIYLPDHLTCMESFSTEHYSNMITVGLKNGEIRMYNEILLCSVIKLKEPIRALKFGRFGREDNTLVVTTSSGSLDIKILARAAKLKPSAATSKLLQEQVPEQDVPLNIPKKTRVYVEQTKREREKASEMHKGFQRDLCKLRLSTARAYVKSITSGQGPIWSSSEASIITNASIFGLGPDFKLEFTLENNGMKALHDLRATITFKSKGIKLERSQFNISTLLPSVQYSFLTNLRCTSSVGTEEQQLKVLISRQESCVPILSAIVKLPVVDQEEQDQEPFQQADFGASHHGMDSKADMLVMG
ncbi:Bardet-Biedl syndrome 1-like protein [Chloropicon primus]|uniref:Bardet-Biedl syndrome 1-like protein n=1 Tax=Chloropicon primus TaxID=1764295 RepID=A0A5B8MIK1_9CHLO|nr:Bardet-Biedl syndrome 1-like protein [Chloropicon primus]UPQ99486.1 Bardet-Biedl syndrome 1-like protein [Chloropicon primus]|eukprot:QDZ20277.1 Bardet-Biedl syndrome 1-like protein [Chloropicon primus]